MLIDGRVVADVQRERRFAHARPGGQDDELLGLKPAGDVIEIEEARGDAGDGVSRLGPRADPVHRLVDNVLELEGVAPGLVLGDAEDLPLGRFQQLLGGEEVRVAFAKDLVGASRSTRG